MHENNNEAPALKWLRAFEAALSIEGVDEAQAHRVANLLVSQPQPRISTRNITWADVNRSR